MSIQLKSFSELTDVYMNDVVLNESKKSGADEGMHSCLCDSRTPKAPDQRMRRTRRDSVVPGDHIPGDGADESGKDDSRVNDRGIYNSLPNRICDAEAKK